MTTTQFQFEVACQEEISRRRRHTASTITDGTKAASYENEDEIQRMQQESILETQLREDNHQCVPASRSLWHGLWFEGELACLFGDPNIGKSVLADQIANDIAATGRKVLYIDFENSDSHFLRRTVFGGEQITANPNVSYLSVKWSADMSARSSIQRKLESIESEILIRKAPVVIIDDISHITPAKFSGRSQQVLQRLRYICQQWRVSILVLAHTRYHRPDSPLSVSHLAGSREFAFSFDSIFALGKVLNPYSEDGRDSEDVEDLPTHYLRQFKARSTRLLYDEDHAIRLHLGTHYSHLMFHVIDCFGIEDQLLDAPAVSEKSQIVGRILSLHAAGSSIREIAREMSVSPSLVYRTISRRPSQPQSQHHPQPQPISSTSESNDSDKEPQNQEKGVSGVSGVSEPSPQSIDSGAMLKEVKSPELARMLQRQAEVTGMPSLLGGYLQGDSPVRELLDEPDLFTANRYAYAYPRYLERIIRHNYGPHYLSHLNSVSIRVRPYDFRHPSPDIRQGSLVYDVHDRTLGEYRYGEVFPYSDHTFAPGVTAEMLTDALIAHHKSLAKKEQGKENLIPASLLAKIIPLSPRNN